MDFDALKNLSASFKPIDLSRIAMPEPIYPTPRSAAIPI